MIFNKTENFTLSLKTFLEFLSFLYKDERVRICVFLLWIKFLLSNRYLNKISVDDLNFILKVLKDFGLFLDPIYKEIENIKNEKEKNEMKLDIDSIISNSIKSVVGNEP